MPKKLAPQDRSIYKEIARDRRKLTRELGMQDALGTQAGKDNVRILYEILGSPQKCATFIVSRIAAAQPAGSDIDAITKLSPMPLADRRKLICVKCPINLSHPGLSRLQDESFLTLLREAPVLLRQSVLAPLDALPWSRHVLVAIEASLGVAVCPTMPESWRLWQEFVYDDPILTACFGSQAKRHFPEYVTATSKKRIPNALRNDLVDVIREEVFLAGINAADTRAKSNSKDLRAEVLKGPLWSLASRRANDIKEKPNTEHKEKPNTENADATTQTRRGSKQYVSEHNLATMTATQEDDVWIRDAIQERLPEVHRVVITMRLHGHDDKAIAAGLNAVGKTLLEMSSVQVEACCDLDGRQPLESAEMIAWQEEITSLASEAKNLMSLSVNKIRKIREEAGNLLKDLLFPG